MSTRVLDIFGGFLQVLTANTHQPVPWRICTLLAPLSRDDITSLEASLTLRCGGSLLLLGLLLALLSSPPVTLVSSSIGEGL
jgi:hypothetical protein